MWNFDLLLVVFAASVCSVASTPDQGYQGSTAPVRNRSLAYMYPMNVPFYVLPEDRDYPSYLRRDISERYLFIIGDQNSSALTIMITPCSATVVWSVYFKNENQTGKLDYSSLSGTVEVAHYAGKKTHIFNTSAASKGLYIVQAKAVERDTNINLYASRYNGQVLALRLQQRPKIRLQRQKKKHKMTVRWEQSMINPQYMHYCVVVNTRRYYDSLCEANADLVGLSPPQRMASTFLNYKREAAVINDQALGLRGDSQPDDYFKIGCVGKKLSFTVDHLEHDKIYYFNVFTIDKTRNLSLPYGNISIKYNKQLKHLSLRDNKLVTVNLRKLDGRASFHYKVSKADPSPEVLHWHIAPCGGAVDIEIRHNCSILEHHHVDGYKYIPIMEPKPGQRFVLKLFVSNDEELRRISGVEVLATTKDTAIPKLPKEMRVFEYTTLRKCNSVTVGWIPALSDDTEFIHYCVSATLQEPLYGSEVDFRSIPNQCSLDARLKKAKNFSVRLCKNISPNDNQNVIVQEIYKLKPGSEYIVQVTVKKTKGKTLSYDLLRVHTKSHCIQYENS